MGLNKAEQNLEMRAVRTIDGMQRDLRDIKTAQPLGADVLKVGGLPSGGFLEGGPATVTAGSYITFIVTITPANQILTIWNFSWSVYVDTDTDPGLWPQAGLTTAQRRVLVTAWHDWATSSDNSNVRVFNIRIKNDDASTHDYYVKFRAYLPSAGGTAS